MVVVEEPGQLWASDAEWAESAIMVRIQLYTHAVLLFKEEYFFMTGIGFKGNELLYSKSI
jgi:hypothetical protein